MDVDYDDLGNLIKYDPAIQADTDRAALRRAVADGRIDIIASGHAPQLLRDKGSRYSAAAAGMPVVQFALPVAWSLVAARMLSPEKLVEKIAHNPARRFGLSERGFAREGCWADLVLLDPARRCVVDEQSQLSQCAWTPFAGRKLPASVAATWVNGRLVWRDGLLTGQVPGQRLQPVKTFRGKASARQPANIGAELAELLLDVFVAAVDVIDAIDNGLTLRHQAGEHQAGGSTQVGCHQRGGRQAVSRP